MAILGTVERPPTRSEEEQALWRAREERIQERGRALATLPHPWWAQALPFLLVPGIYACAFAAGAADGFARLPWIAAGGVLYTWLGIYGHDCTHGAYSHNEKRNRWMGTWILAHAFASFEAYRALHVAHHLNTGFPEDPSGDSPVIQDQANLFTHVLLVFLPLGFPLFQVLPGWLAAVGLEPRAYPKCVRRRIRGDFVFTVCLQALLLTWMGAGVWSMLVAIYFMGTFLIIQLLGFNHVSTEAYTDVCLLNTRNVGSSGWIRLLTLNAGLHVEHHILPKVPWYRLPELHRILVEEAGETPYASPSFLGAHLEVLRAHWRALFTEGASSPEAGEPPPEVPPPVL